MEDNKMILTKEKYCDSCEKCVDASVIERPAAYTFKDETFNIKERVLICSCGEELYD